MAITVIRSAPSRFASLSAGARGKAATLPRHTRNPARCLTRNTKYRICHPRTARSCRLNAGTGKQQHAYVIVHSLYPEHAALSSADASPIASSLQKAASASSITNASPLHRLSTARCGLQCPKNSPVHLDQETAILHTNHTYLPNSGQCFKNARLILPPQTVAPLSEPLGDPPPIAGDVPESPAATYSSLRP